MKKFVFFGVLAMAIAFTPLVANAQNQSSGYWGTCIDPFGDEAKCWVPGRAPERPTKVVVNQNIQQNVYINTAPARRYHRQPSHQQVRHNDDDESYGSNRNVEYEREAERDREEPVYQTQRVRTVRKGCTFGRGQYSGIIYGQCTFQTDTARIDIITNDRRYRPDIVIRVPYWYSYPNY